ncbi:hypothetical protein niasHT_006133 [Heterodera trifolii]|uniref:Uncharacterized protein n=1 Tax=Heterodera trifolii TaxID=157864 RepID=A0ABD2I6T5_9BILA
MANPSKNIAMLREARSSPYIGGGGGSGGTLPPDALPAAGPMHTRLQRNRRPDSATAPNTARLQNAASAEDFEQLKELIQFSAGSSSSTSLIAAGLHFGTEQSIENYGRLKAESVDNLSEVSGICPTSSAVPSITESRASITSMTATAGSMSPTLMETTNLRSSAKQHCSETNLHVREGVVGLRDNGFKILEKCCSVELSPAKVMIPPSRLARTKEMPNIMDIDDNEYIS